MSWIKHSISCTSAPKMDTGKLTHVIIAPQCVRDNTDIFVFKLISIIKARPSVSVSYSSYPCKQLHWLYQKFTFAIMDKWMWVTSQNTSTCWNQYSLVKAKYCSALSLGQSPCNIKGSTHEVQSTAKFCEVTFSVLRRQYILPWRSATELWKKLSMSNVMQTAVGNWDSWLEPWKLCYISEALL